MAPHLATLNVLLRQSAAYELSAGNRPARRRHRALASSRRGGKGGTVSRLVVELTNRCNLRCQHCYGERHAATGELSLELLEKVLREGKDCGIDHLSFTGGEPTMHSQFEEVVRRVAEARYTFGFVSNGSTLPKIYGLLVRHRAAFKGATFSLDGAREETHDALRGKGSYRQVMRAATVCVARDLPFTLNMVLTPRNRGEIEEMISLGARLGSGAVRFGHVMPTPDTAAREAGSDAAGAPRDGGRDLAPPEERAVAGHDGPRILQRVSLLPVRPARARGVQSRLPRESDPLLPALRLRGRHAGDRPHGKSPRGQPRRGVRPFPTDGSRSISRTSGNVSLGGSSRSSITSLAGTASSTWTRSLALGRCLITHGHRDSDPPAEDRP